MLWKGHVRFLRPDGKRPGPWLAATVAVPCPKLARRLVRRAVEPEMRANAEIVSLPYHLEPMPRTGRKK